MARNNLPYWSVRVEDSSGTLVVIESECLSGKPEFTPEEEETIRRAAEHLLAFISPREKASFEIEVE